MEFEFRQFTNESFAATEAAWLDSSENLAMSSIEFEKSLDRARTRIDYEKGVNSYAYGIFKKDEEEAVAIVDVTYSTKVKDIGWLKMLDVAFNPHYSDVDQTSSETFSEKMEIYVTSIYGTIELSNHHKAKVVKLYGRHENLLTLLYAMNYHLKDNADSAFNTKIEGRWLVFSTH